jgi:hypothetical protein
MTLGREFDMTKYDLVLGLGLGRRTFLLALLA